jgi:hypothetical protein
VTSVAEEVIYLVEGKRPEESRPKDQALYAPAGGQGG